MRNLFLALALTVGSLSATPSDATVYVVHGIPGTALGSSSTDLPVDIKVNGSCVAALSGLNFGEIRGPLALPAPAVYTVEIKPANTLNPCGNATVLSSSAAVTPGINASVVAHLKANGTPFISVFVNDVSRTDPGQGRVVLHHTAQAPAVDVRAFRGQGKGNVPSIDVPGFSNGAQVPAELRPGQWRVTLSAGGAVVFGAENLLVQPNTVQLVYAIGTFPDSFTLVTKTIPANR